MAAAQSFLLQDVAQVELSSEVSSFRVMGIVVIDATVVIESMTFGGKGVDMCFFGAYGCSSLGPSYKLVLMSVLIHATISPNVVVTCC